MGLRIVTTIRNCDGVKVSTAWTGGIAFGETLCTKRGHTTEYSGRHWEYTIILQLRYGVSRPDPEVDRENIKPRWVAVTSGVSDL